MGLNDKWKNAGKNIGGAFGNFGKSIGKTAKVAFTDEENKKEENGHTELGNAWVETGKSFGEAGKSFGKAMQGTAQKIIGVEDKEEKEKTDDVVTEEASEVVDDSTKEIEQPK